MTVLFWHLRLQIFPHPPVVSVPVPHAGIGQTFGRGVVSGA